MKSSSILLLSLLLAGPNAFAQGSKAMNPDIGANFITHYQQNTSKYHQGWSLEEAEFSMKSDVDPYLTATAIFSVSRNATTHEYGIEPEEVYVDTTFIPKLTLRAGKFYQAFGKHNTLHTHAFPFIDAPLINTTLLGDAGMNNAAISAAYLLPTSWYSELIVQEFGEDFKSLARYRNLFELNEDSTIEFGVSGVTKWAYGADITYKHRPTDVGQGRRFNVAIEWMSGNPNSTGGSLTQVPTQGYDTYFQYEFLPRTFVQYRFDDVITNKQTRHGALLAYAPSEFSVFRLQGDITRQPLARDEKRILAQINISIGAHPAHDY